MSDKASFDAITDCEWESGRKAKIAQDLGFLSGKVQIFHSQLMDARGRIVDSLRDPIHGPFSKELVMLPGDELTLTFAIDPGPTTMEVKCYLDSLFIDHYRMVRFALRLLSLEVRDDDSVSVTKFLNALEGDTAGTRMDDLWMTVRDDYAEASKRVQNRSKSLRELNGIRTNLTHKSIKLGISKVHVEGSMETSEEIVVTGLGDVEFQDLEVEILVDDEDVLRKVSSLRSEVGELVEGLLSLVLAYRDGPSS